MPAERVEQIRRWHERAYRDEAGFDRTVVAERSQTKDGWTVDYLTFRMTPRPEWTTE
ncbi:methylase of polypeptide chain release factors [Saccharomonospora azurea SZMC 14600]|nr:methylase of polypeptide chain release factors [Saccharomonospora azurea SZMC 14600]